MKLLEMKTWKMKAETGHPCDSSTDEGSEKQPQKTPKIDQSMNKHIPPVVVHFLSCSS